MSRGTKVGGEGGIIRRLSMGLHDLLMLMVFRVGNNLLQETRIRMIMANAVRDFRKID
jgi:hypothetical protein